MSVLKFLENSLKSIILISVFQLNKLRLKRDIFGAGASLFVDKVLEVQETLEHGVKIKDKSEREIGRKCKFK